MDKLVLTATGGFPLKLDDLLWMDGRLDAANKGMYDAIQAHLLAYGTDYIVEGCTYADPNITAGWIMLDSELMRVDAHAGTDDFFVRTVTFDARGSKTFKDTSVNNTYEKIRGVLSGASGSLDINAALRLEDKIIQLLATSSEQFAAANIPDLPASKTTSGTFAAGRIPLATESAVGGRELATQSETNTGTNDITIVTPLKLRTTAFVAGQIPNLSANKITADTFAAARLPVATESAIGALEISTTAEAQALTADDKIITPSKLADVNGGMLTEIVDIGDWNMNDAVSGDLEITVSHGISDFTKIRNVSVLIRSDVGIGTHYLLTSAGDSGTTPQGGIGQITVANITLRVLSGGTFDAVTFDSTSYNRGWIIIDHIP